MALGYAEGAVLVAASQGTGGLCESDDGAQDIGMLEAGAIRAHLG
jgi:hypothetical protein